MNLRTLSTAVPKLLPTLMVPAALLASTAAHAANLDISNGFFSAKTPTTIGYDFKMNVSGTTQLNGVTRATSIALVCSFNTAAIDLHCDGTLKLHTASAPIRMDYTSANQRAEWSISASASAALDVIHEEWGKQVLPPVLGDPPGWDHVDFHDGTQWRRFYYTLSSAETWESITGLPHEEYLEIWTW